MLAAAMLAASLCVSCQASKPVEIAKPGGVDLDAAAEIGPNGNGLWLLDGPVAASSVIEALWPAAMVMTSLSGMRSRCGLSVSVRTFTRIGSER